MTPETTTIPEISRKLTLLNGPRRLASGDLDTQGFIHYLDQLIEVQPGVAPKNIFVILDSPHRNGNTHLAESVVPQVGAGRAVSRLTVCQSSGKWDSAQYPRLLQSLAPVYRHSESYRAALRRRFDAPARRALSSILDYALLVVVFLLSEVVFSLWLSVLDTHANASFTAILVESIRRLTGLPWWAHVVSATVAVLLELARRFRENLSAALLPRRPRDPGYHLSEDDFDLFREHDFAAFSFFLQPRIAGPCFVWIDRADTLDELSESALEQLLVTNEPQTSNRIIVLQFGSKKVPLFYRLRKYCEEFAHIEERLIEVKLNHVPTDERIEVARALGKSERDARATRLIADLVEVSEPRLLALATVCREILTEELADRDTAGAGVLLAALATAGTDGPRQFAEGGPGGLRDTFCRQRSTFARWLGIVGIRPFFPKDLMEVLEYLQKAGGDLPLVRQVGGPSNREWVVDPEVQRAVFEVLGETTTWIRSIRAFWAAYLGERLSTVTAAQHPPDEGEDHGPPARLLDALNELSWHLAAAVLPDATAAQQEDALADFASVQIRSANYTLPKIMEFAQFDRAFQILERLFSNVIQRPEPWHDASFVREVERMSETVWRLAMARGASQVIVGFQKYISDRGARAGSKGISASVTIFDSYNQAIQFNPIDIGELDTLTVAGGDEATRAFLSNMRSYAINLDLIRKHALVLECIEHYSATRFGSLDALFEQLREPTASPQFDFFYFLVSDQCIRLWLHHGDFERAIEQLKRNTQLLNDHRDLIHRDDVVSESNWHLARALNRLVMLDTIASGGRFLVLGFPVILDCIPEVYEAQSPLNGEEFLAIPAERTESAIEEAEFLQHLCDVSFGKACLANAALRYQVVRASLNGPHELLNIDTLFESALGDARRLGAAHLAFGSMATRLRHRQNIESWATCIKALAQESIRLQLSRPARVLIPEFASIALLLNDDRLYQAAADALVYLTSSEPPPSGTSEYLEWVGANLERAQFLRLLGQYQECLDIVLRCTPIDPEAFDEDLAAKALEMSFDGQLQVCWCHRALKHDAQLDALVASMLGDDGVRSWSGFPLLLEVRLRRQQETGDDAEQAVSDTLDRAFTTEHSGDYPARTVIQLLQTLIVGCLGGQLSESTRLRVIAAARDRIEHLGEWTGLRESTEFLRTYLALDHDADPAIQNRYESLLARDAMSAARLAELETSLQQGGATTLLQYLMTQLDSRIAVSAKESSRQAMEILNQVHMNGPISLSAEQIDFCTREARDVGFAEGKVVVHGALYVLRELQQSIGDTDVAEAWGAAVTQSTFTATLKMLGIIANRRVDVHPQLAHAMQTYLKVCEAFSRAPYSQQLTEQMNRDQQPTRPLN